MPPTVDTVSARIVIDIASGASPSEIHRDGESPGVDVRAYLAEAMGRGPRTNAETVRGTVFEIWAGTAYGLS
jgi:hypothetical protein